MSDIILNHLKENKPTMIARFGANEIKAVIYPNLSNFLKPLFKNLIYKRMFTVAGFYPVNENNLTLFSKIMKKDIKFLDILASWRPEELLLRRSLNHVKKIELINLEPYLNSKPWTSHLVGKNVLVVHPFSDLIKSQYLRRKLLFENQSILPEFNLITFKSVQSVSGNSRFANWFEALEYMKSEIDKIKFDICIIGCGAYGFPLAAHVKRMGKIGIHMGGCLQILFGIKGRRWDNMKLINKFYNEHWVRPTLQDRPDNFLKVEDGCYW